jgi:hypothetical protein
MAKYIKLGEKAQSGSFYCPVLKLSLSPGQVIVAPKPGLAAQSVVYKDAIKNLHVVPADEEEYNEYMETKDAELMEEAKKVKASKKKKVKPVVEEDEEEEEIEEEEIEEEEIEEEETDEDEEEDEDDLTKSEMVAALREVTELDDNIKKNLGKLGDKKLQELYNTYINKK